MPTPRTPAPAPVPLWSILGPLLVGVVVYGLTQGVLVVLTMGSDAVAPKMLALLAGAWVTTVAWATLSPAMAPWRIHGTEFALVVVGGYAITEAPEGWTWGTAACASAIMALTVGSLAHLAAAHRRLYNGHVSILGRRLSGAASHRWSAVSACLFAVVVGGGALIMCPTDETRLLVGGLCLLPLIACTGSGWRRPADQTPPPVTVDASPRSQRPSTGHNHPQSTTPGPVHGTPHGEVAQQPGSGPGSPHEVRHKGKRLEPLTHAEAQRKLRRMIGLSAVKAQIAQLEASVKMDRERAAAGIPIGEAPRLHMVFVGNPGVGKTVVAQIIGAILHGLGVLPSGHVIACNPSDLKGEYQGHSGAKAASACDDAQGGVLLVDEAYALARDAFGQEASEEIMVRAENDGQRFVVIMAGYPTEMEALLASNPGMPSRFPRRLTFENYTLPELMQIAAVVAPDYGKTLAPDAVAAIEHALRQVDLTSPRWSNARAIRNLIDDARQRLDLRISRLPSRTVEDHTTLTAADLDLSILALGPDPSV